ncbi:hypothetical protein [Brucella intermedia]|uniref:DNA polymerase III subunit beta family protein n=1 Tax=Brucella intermedia TaxID=94625 RepID=UPI00159022AD|nr:hypothetical protein [Brucella intermedia]
MSHIRINARLFRAAHVCVSTDATRYYLQGVQVEKHPVRGVFLVATDGHRMVIIHDESGSIEGESQIVRFDKTALALCKAAKSETGDRTIVIDGASATIENRLELPVGTAYGVVIDGTFPDWRRVARPNLDSTAPAAYNPKYIADFGKIADELSGKNSVAISIAGDTDSPALVRFNFIDYAYGVLMPIRFNETPTKFPMLIDRCEDAPAY